MLAKITLKIRLVMQQQRLGLSDGKVEAFTVRLDAWARKGSSTNHGVRWRNSRRNFNGR
jgi:hypothetical protein